MSGRICLAVLVLAGVGISYIVSPLWTAWSLREAIKSGDRAYLEEKIDWPRVRESLSASLLQTDGEASGDHQRPAMQQAPQRGLWQNLKSWVNRSMVDGFVNANVTPDGLPRLFGIGKTYRSVVHGEAEPERTLANLPERVLKFWSRVKRAEFRSLNRFEVDFLDKYNPGRLYIGTLALDYSGWRLVELRIKQVPSLVSSKQGARAL